MTWFCFSFDFVRSHPPHPLEREKEEGEGEVRLKLDVQVQGGWKVSAVRQDGLESRKLDNFHGHHMCTIPCILLPFSINSIFYAIAFHVLATTSFSLHPLSYMSNSRGYCLTFWHNISSFCKVSAAIMSTFVPLYHFHF